MKTTSSVLSAVLLLVCFTSQSAWGISLTDYKFPKSTSQQAYVNGSFSSTDDSDDTTQLGYSLGGSASYDLFYRSLPLTYQINTAASTSLERATAAGAESNSAYDIQLRSSANKYFRESSDFFGSGRTRLEYRKLASQDQADDPYWDITVGAGYGRTIDATVLKQAMRMNDDFKKYGVITKDIPDKSLLELASIIDLKSEYQTRHGNIEYRKYWYEDMESVIRKSGVLKGEGLGALGLIRIQEVLDEPTGRRYYGREARVGVGVVISDFTGERGDPVLEAALDWARPVGIQLQLTNNAALSTVFRDDQVYTMTNLFQVYYEISNRIDWDNRLTARYDILTAESAENIFSLNFSSVYTLYIENQLTFNPGFVANYVDDGIGDSQWDWNLSGSIGYRLR